MRLRYSYSRLRPCGPCPPSHPYTSHPTSSAAAPTGPFAPSAHSIPPPAPFRSRHSFPTRPALPASTHPPPATRGHLGHNSLLLLRLLLLRIPLLEHVPLLLPLHPLVRQACAIPPDV